MVEVGCEPSDIHSFCNGSALNPDCAITMHLRNDLGSFESAFGLAEESILNKVDLLS